MRIWTFLFTLAFLLPAQANETKIHGKPLFVSPPAKQITNVGQNRQAQFITDEDIVFISRSRNDHKDPQLYFKNLRKNKEKRITHQRGEINGGVIVNNQGKIIYSSTTDEEKETPFILKNYLDRFPSSVKNDHFFHLNFAPQEIYASQIDGTKIERLTEYPGFDGTPTYLEDKDRIYFSRWTGQQISIFAKSLSKHIEPWKLMKTTGNDLGLQLSPNKRQFVWSRFSPDFKSSQLLLSDLNFKNPEFLTLESGINWSPVWHPNGKTIIYSARNGHKGDFDLHEVSADGKCTRQLTSYAGDEFFPSVSPNGHKLMFTSTKTGREQIHEITYPTTPICQ